MPAHAQRPWASNPVSGTATPPEPIVLPPSECPAPDLQCFAKVGQRQPTQTKKARPPSKFANCCPCGLLQKLRVRRVFQLPHTATLGWCNWSSRPLYVRTALRTMRRQVATRQPGATRDLSSGANGTDISTTRHHGHNRCDVRRHTLMKLALAVAQYNNKAHADCTSGREGIRSKRVLLVLTDLLQLMRETPDVNERCPQDFDTTFSRLCFQPSSPHSRPFHRNVCSPFEEVASCWSDARAIPHFRFACMHLDAGMSPQRVLQCSVDHTNPLGAADNMYIVQKSEEQFSGS